MQERGEIVDRKLELNAELASLHGRLAVYLQAAEWLADTTVAMFEGEYRQELNALRVLERARDDLARWVDRLEG